MNHKCIAKKKYYRTYKPLHKGSKKYVKKTKKKSPTVGEFLRYIADDYLVFGEDMGFLPSSLAKALMYNPKYGVRFAKKLNRKGVMF